MVGQGPLQSLLLRGPGYGGPWCLEQYLSHVPAVYFLKAQHTDSIHGLVCTTHARNQAKAQAMGSVWIILLPPSPMCFANRSS